MSNAEVHLNMAMYEKYRNWLGEYPKKGVILCILENGDLGIDFDKSMPNIDKKGLLMYMDFKGCKRWDNRTSCTGVMIRG